VHVSVDEAGRDEKAGDVVRASAAVNLPRGCTLAIISPTMPTSACAFERRHVDHGAAGQQQIEGSAPGRRQWRAGGLRERWARSLDSAIRL